jgi:hypothetical protein
MKLFLLSQDVNDNYDTYDSVVVAAPNEETARLIHPGDEWPPPDAKYKTGDVIIDLPNNRTMWNDWAYRPEEVKVKYIGEAAEGIEQGVVCASFNAG